MLVLTRKQNEKIRIGNEVTITILRTRGKGVRLGIEAPAHINILRGELAFDLTMEELAIETTGVEGAGGNRAIAPAPRQSGSTKGHRQQPATNWPAVPVARTVPVDHTSTAVPRVSR